MKRDTRETIGRIVALLFLMGIIVLAIYIALS